MIQGILKVAIDQLNLPKTLATGQNFRWRKRPNTEEWIGLLDNHLVVSLEQSPNFIKYTLLNENANEKVKTQKDHLEKRLTAYFRLDENIEKLYSRWSRCDEHFAKTSAQFRGIRLLHQDVVENIFSFICSSNNNISRISKMIEALCTKYGTKLYSFSADDKDESLMPDVYSFPTVDELAKDKVEDELRQLSFGYRSRYISGSAKQIISAAGKGGSSDQWIDKLQKLTYEDAKRELMSLPGIGAKVADCICLMSLGHTEAIPVDTHVFQITAKHYLPHLLNKGKSLTAQRYSEIGDFYREKFQEHAGWAQTVLFASNLKSQSS